VKNCLVVFEKGIKKIIYSFLKSRESLILNLYGKQ